MKKIAIASAIAIATISSAHAAPKVYGKIFLSTDYVDTDYSGDKKDESVFKLNSNSSRIGFKGEDSLTDNLDLVYQLEYGINVDNGGSTSNGANGSQFTSRNTYIGISNRQYGTLLAGRMDTPFKTSKGNVDVFNNNGAAGLSIDTVGPAGFTNLGENRANDVIAYKSPAIVGVPVTFTAAVSLSETDADTRKLLKAAEPATPAKLDAQGNIITPAVAAKPAVYSEKKDKDNGYSTSLAYDQNGVYLAAGYDNNVGVEDSAWRIAGSVDLGKMNMMNGVVLGALYQNADIYDTKDDAKTWLISGKYRIPETKWTAKAQYINTDFGSNDAKEYVIGGEYEFNKNAIGHLYAGKVERDNFTKYDRTVVQNGKNVTVSAIADKDDTIIGAGLEYKF